MTKNENSIEHIQQAWEGVRAEWTENQPSNSVAEQWQQKQAERLETVNPEILKILEDGQKVLAENEQFLPPEQFASLEQSYKNLERVLLEGDARVKAAAAEPKMLHHTGVEVIVP